MEHRGIEYQVVLTIERVWKWSVEIKSNDAKVATTGTEKSRHGAIAAAERAIDRTLRVAKVKLVPRED